MRKFLLGRRGVEPAYSDMPAVDQPRPQSEPSVRSRHCQVPLVIAPNPALSKAHRKVIELDYGMVDGDVVLECRQALLFYSLNRLGLLDAAASEPHRQQIVLKNRAAVLKFLPAVSMEEGRA